VSGSEPGRPYREHRRAPLVGDERDAVAQRLAQRYAQGTSKRALVEDTGMSYGLVHNLLVEGGAPLRPAGRPRGSGGVTSAPRTTEGMEDAYSHPRALPPAPEHEETDEHA
jgi:hypothetical protein